MGGQNPPLTYKQICRQDNIAVYERSLNGEIRDYETIIIRTAKAGDEVFNKVYDEDQEFYPGSSTWGKMGFSYHGVTAKNAAINKFNKLLKDAEQSINPAPEKGMVIPDGDFTTTMLAEINNTNYVTASSYIKNNPDKIIFIEEKRLQSKGKMSRMYRKI